MRMRGPRMREMILWRSMVNDRLNVQRRRLCREESERLSRIERRLVLGLWWYVFSSLSSLFHHLPVFSNFSTSSFRSTLLPRLSSSLAVTVTDVVLLSTGSGQGNETSWSSSTTSWSFGQGRRRRSCYPYQNAQVSPPLLSCVCVRSLMLSLQVFVCGKERKWKDEQTIGSAPPSLVVLVYYSLSILRSPNLVETLVSRA